MHTARRVRPARTAKTRVIAKLMLAVEVDVVVETVSLPDADIESLTVARVKGITTHTDSTHQQSHSCSTGEFV